MGGLLGDTPAQRHRRDRRRQRNNRAKLCRFAPFGTCKLGDQCHFAHDVGQLNLSAGAAREELTRLAEALGSAELREKIAGLSRAVQGDQAHFAKHCRGEAETEAAEAAPRPRLGLRAPPGLEDVVLKTGSPAIAPSDASTASWVNDGNGSFSDSGSEAAPRTRLGLAAPPGLEDVVLKTGSPAPSNASTASWVDDGDGSFSDSGSEARSGSAENRRSFSLPPGLPDPPRIGERLLHEPEMRMPAHSVRIIR